MATTTGTFVWYNKGKLNLMKAVTDLDTDTIKFGLTTSTYTPSATTHEFYDVDITNEVASGTGYTTGGVALTSVTVTETGGTVTFDSADPSFTASGGSIVARYWFIYDDTPASSKPLIAYGLLDNTPADVTTTTGNSLTYNVPAGGWATAA